MDQTVRPVALITGAAAGIGRATALALARAGYETCATDLDEASLQSLATHAQHLNLRVHVAAADLLQDQQLQAVVDRVGREFGRLDALVHSAGLFPRKSFSESTVEDLDRVMGVNFRAAFRLAALSIPLMTDGGAMIFLTSGSGLLAAVADPMQTEFSLYGASKAALDRWALGIAAELSRLGVTVNTLTPGAFVLTPGVAALGLRETEERPSISPEAVAEAIAWLAGSPADGPCGQRLSATEFRQSWGPRAGG